jgi:hypothetical protein
LRPILMDSAPEVIIQTSTHTIDTPTPTEK